MEAKSFFKYWGGEGTKRSLKKLKWGKERLNNEKVDIFDVCRRHCGSSSYGMLGSGASWKELNKSGRRSCGWGVSRKSEQ